MGGNDEPPLQGGFGNAQSGAEQPLPLVGFPSFLSGAHALSPQRDGDA